MIDIDAIAAAAQRAFEGMPSNDDVPGDEMLLAEMILRYEIRRAGNQDMICEGVCEDQCLWCALGAVEDVQSRYEPGGESAFAGFNGHSRRTTDHLDLFTAGAAFDEYTEDG